MTDASPHIRVADTTRTELGPGFVGRFVHGDTMTVAIWQIRAGSRLPGHSHPHEQIVNLVAGSLEMRVGDQTYLMAPGDAVVIRGGIEHSALARTDVRCIDVFHPIREDYRL
ncbi:cupin domain-containing protein [Frankia gtarii]|uniref:cupin domain-containing protein n=1 Tax=Frankia gtarii TaxID=2950102 RepID=UPI0021BFB9EE|nr:cupin domain-containing protein [Frankia gtarii]